jgi:hypothetical protein
VSEHEDIRDGEAMESFLKTDEWKRTVERIRTRYAEQFAAAPNPEAATKVWYRFQAFEDIKDGMNTTANRGVMAKQVKGAREKQGKK